MNQKGETFQWLIVMAHAFGEPLVRVTEQNRNRKQKEQKTMKA